MNRKKLLRDLIDARYDGNQSAFARKIGRSSAQVNQWLGGYREIGDAAARLIEIKCGLGQGYFDTGIIYEASIRQTGPPSPMVYTKIVDALPLLGRLELDLLKAHVDFLYSQQQAIEKESARAALDTAEDQQATPKKAQHSAA